jgi:shikimate kinase
MSVSGPPSAARARELVLAIVNSVDPRLAPALRDALRGGGEGGAWPGPSSHAVLVGHRAAGKSTLLPLVAELLGRPACDLDEWLERRAKRPIVQWLREDERSFRQAEREGFLELPAASAVAVGGGFLSLHRDLLAGHFALLVPITLATYRERLMADKSRPRLLPHLPLEVEIEQVFSSREKIHAAVPTHSLAAFLRSALAHSSLGGAR